jgi:acetate kinase
MVSAGQSALVFNCGSSSLKFGLYQSQSAEVREVFSAHHELGDAPQRLLAQAFQQARQALNNRLPDVIGHRVVHGGPHIRHHCRVDERVLKQLKAASGFAPLHNQLALEVIHQAAEAFTDVPQVACLDTAFHANMPEIARTFPLTRELQREGVERYGFHGLSCESILDQLGNEVLQRLVIAHLGNGVSVTAIRNGISVDTTMGLTPAGGVMMATRSGDIDPGLVTYLLREKNYKADRLDELLNHRAGMLGVSLLSGDMRRLREAESTNPDAALAIRMFCYSVCKHIAAMVAALQGIDLLVFTGGIGQHDEATRREICEGLRWLGLDDRVRIMNTQEESMIARHAFRLIAAGK